jgi:hypothetical protein
MVEYANLSEQALEKIRELEVALLDETGVQIVLVAYQEVEDDDE